MNRFLNERAVSGLMLILLAVSMPTFMFWTKMAGNAQSGAGGSWLAGWTYRKAHNITGSSAGDQMNYPILMSVRYGHGVDSQGEVYLNGKCRSDFGDVRFTDSSGGNLLDFYIEQKTDDVQALFWVKMGSIPENPTQTQIYIYYGSSNASTTSNKDLTFDSASDFEDGAKQGWVFASTSYVQSDGVSTNAFEGSFSRSATRIYGTNGGAGTGNFYERFSKQTVYLATGSYRMECAAAFSISDGYRVPYSIKLMVNEITVNEVSSPGVVWHLLVGNFTLDSSAVVSLNVEFHLGVAYNLWTGEESYFVDSIFVRRWCDPEPSHGAWGPEEYYIKPPPEIASVSYLPTCPYPYVFSNDTRTNEPTLVSASVSASEGSGGIAAVELSYRISGGEWWNTSMTFNATSNLWTVIVPGQLGNAAVDFCITVRDNAGTTITSNVQSFNVKSLPMGDMNGDGAVDIYDVVHVAIHYGETIP